MLGSNRTSPDSSRQHHGAATPGARGMRVVPEKGFFRNQYRRFTTLGTGQSKSGRPRLT
jgi:hypothetical protein